MYSVHFPKHAMTSLSTYPPPTVCNLIEIIEVHKKYSVKVNGQSGLGIELCHID